MMKEQREQRSPRVSSPVYSLVASSEDEISLFDLFRILLRKWKIVCAVVGLSILGAAAYIFQVIPLYEVQAVVVQPDGKYVEVLNINDSSQVSRADIFTEFIRNLKSNSLRRQFVDENPQFSSLKESVFNIRIGEKKEEGFVFLSLQGHNSKLMANWVDSFILYAERKTLGDFFAVVEIKIANQKKEIQDYLQIERDAASKRRLDRIALLEEQITIARAAKIFERRFSAEPRSRGQNGGVTVDSFSEPLYLRGVNELVAEKESLEKRRDDEPFIAGLRDKQVRLAQLDAMVMHLESVRANIHAVIVDQPAIQSEASLVPKRMHVLAFSLLFGFMVAVLVAFLVHVAEHQKMKTQ